MADDRKADAKPESPAKRRLEAVASVIGAALALGTMAVILLDGLKVDKVPPFVTANVLDVVQVGDGFVAEVDAFNAGDSTAAQVVVSAELSRGGKIVETSEATFDYVPKRSSRRGGLFFSEDPRTGDLRVRAQGYMEP